MASATALSCAIFAAASEAALETSADEAAYFGVPFQGFFSITQLTIIEQSSGVPWALPKPSASKSVEIRFFDEARPRTRPVLSNTGPPEFPGLIAAVKVNVLRMELVDEMIPVVRIPDTPSGEPNTPTHHPCLGFEPTHCKAGIVVFTATPAMSSYLPHDTIVPGRETLLFKTTVTDLFVKQFSIT